MWFIQTRLGLLEKLDKKNAALDNILEGLTPAEAKALNSLLDKIREPH